MEITAKELKNLLHYDPAIGVFTWIKSRGRCKAGSIAGTQNGNGYTRINLSGSKYYAHRLAWLYMTGEMPVGQVDHKNLDRSDNSYTNLRDATHGQNSANRSGRAASGLKGVQKHGRIWRIQLWRDGKNNIIGPFQTKEEAHDAYKVAHAETHGKFTRT